ncbi:MAG TPA: rod shape-determining protein MreD [Thermomicrobiales bacterium]|nr:rod shape-determining protein MreD [Thermomicrobiales bacterium]
MARLAYGLLLFATVIAQATFLPRLNPLAVTPDLALVLLFLWAARHSVRESLMWIFVFGVILDVLALDPLGVHALALVPVVVLAHPLRISPWRFSATGVMLLIFLTSLFHGVILAILRGTSPDVMTIAIQTVLQVILIPVFFFLLRLVGR